jgi:heterodisulfide reductase subunit B
LSFDAESLVLQFARQRKKIKINRNIILPVVLHGCETCSFTLKEERRLRMLENRVLRRIFGPKRDEITGEWIKLHNDELNDLYSSPNTRCRP